MKFKDILLNNIYFKSTVLVLIIFGSGYFMGNGCGTIMLKDLLLGNGVNEFLLYSPSNEFYSIYSHLNSKDDLKRLNGYYALADNKLVDEEFILERFSLEESPVLKRTIVWLMGTLKNNSNIENFLIRKYSTSSDFMKMEILRSLRRVNRKRFEEFVKDMNIDQKTIDKL